MSYREPKLIPKRVIKVNVNRRLLLHLLNKDIIKQKDFSRVSQLKRNLEAAQNQLSHVLSIVDIIDRKFNRPTV